MNIQLHSDEVLLKQSSAQMDGLFANIALTNKRLVWYRKYNKSLGFFKGYETIEEEKEWLLSEVKMYNGEPVVKVAGDYYEPVLQIQHVKEIIELKFENKSETESWVDEIHIAITGHKSAKAKSTSKSFAIPGVDKLGKGIKDTVEAFTAGLGINEMREADLTISTKCPFCGAPLTGLKGEKSKCAYCDGISVLK